jgi:hypothetical protein
MGVVQGELGQVADLAGRLDRRDELCVFNLAGAGRPGEASMEARARYIQNFAEPADWPDVTMLCNEGEPHIASRAKKAVAFFRKSGSTRRPATSFFTPQSRPDRPASARYRETL